LNAATGADLTEEEKVRLNWLFRPTLDTSLAAESRLLSKEGGLVALEFGPRFTFSTAYSTNAISICSAVGLAGRIVRIERSTIYRLKLKVSDRSSIKLN
jgi:phosphoribosylformylglycinamidine synthase